MKKTHKYIRIISLLLTFILLISSIPITAYDQTTDELKTTIDTNVSNNEIPSSDFEFSDNKIISEIVSRREESVKHFDLGQGNYQAIAYGKAVHRKDADGNWQDIDNRLYLNEKNTLYSTIDGRTTVSSTANTSESLISLNENGYTISMTPICSTSKINSPAEIINHSENTVSYERAKDTEKLAQISNTTKVKYKNVFTSTDIEYILTSNDIKENIIVNKPKDDYEYSFRLTLTNLKPKLTETGEIILYDLSTGENKYIIPAPFMYDANGKYSYDVRYELIDSNSEYIIRIIADKEWINSSDRAFPLTIDPTIKASILFDTYINSSSPATNYGSSEELWISSSKISFLRCSMPTLPSGCQFSSARLYVYYYYYSNVTSNSITAGAYQILNSWNETGSNGLTWNIANQNTNMGISTTRLSTGNLSGSRGAYIDSPQITSFDVTAAADSWYNSSSSNYGIALKYETGTNSAVILKSYETYSDYTAYYIVTYTEPVIANGVYKIKNLYNGLYLDVTDGGVTSGTPMQQWSGTSTDNNRNQLFKITFVATSGSLNYYTIRPMTNSGMGVETLFGSNRTATIESISTTDSWANLLYNHLWAISKTGNYYTIKNGASSVNSYLRTPANSTNGSTVYTETSTGTSTNCKWTLELYTGGPINDIVITNFTTAIDVGDTYDFDAYMYSATIGRNGPIIWSVVNTDDSATTKATINSYTGVLTANSPGEVKVVATYNGAAYNRSKNVTIYGTEPSNNPYATLMALQDGLNHGADERDNYFSQSEIYINSVGKYTVQKINFNNYSVSQMISQIEQSKIISIHTHGAQNAIFIAPDEYNQENNPSGLFLTSSDIATAAPDLSDTDLILLLTCNTGLGGFDYDLAINYNNPANIVGRLAKCGAKNVIGFNATTNIDECNNFAQNLFEMTMVYHQNIKYSLDVLCSPNNEFGCFSSIAQYAVLGYSQVNYQYLYID